MIDHETAAETARRYIEAKRDIVKLMQIIRETVRKFAGKVYNKRFDTALQAAITAKYGTGENGRPLYFTNVERAVNRQYLYISAYRAHDYSSRTTLCNIILPESGRIDSKQAIASCGKYYAEILQKCAEIEEKLQIVPQIIEQLCSLYRVREALKKSVPREIYDWFRLDDVDKWGR